MTHTEPAFPDIRLPSLRPDRSLSELQQAIAHLLPDHAQVRLIIQPPQLTAIYTTAQSDYELHFQPDWTARLLRHLSHRSDVYPDLNVTICTPENTWRNDTLHARLRRV